MRYGVCTDPDNITMAKECGFDFVEYQFRELNPLSEVEIDAIVSDCEKHGVWFGE